MPPTQKAKKKKVKSKTKHVDKKKGSKKNAKGAVESKDPEETEELTYTERALLDIRIKSLEEKLENREDVIEKLRNETENYKIGFEEEVKDKEDTVAFLKRALRDRAVEITELQEKLIGIQQVHRKNVEKLDFRFNQLQAEYQLCKDKLTEENMLLTGKLSALEDFRVQKEDILNKLAETEDKLVDRENHYKNELDRIEKEVLSDKEKLVKDVVHQVDTLAYEFRKASSDQLSFTIKRTIEENVQLHVQLKETSEKSLTLVRENQTLNKSLKKCKDDLLVYQMTETKLATQFEALRKAYKIQSSKFETQKTELDDMSGIRFRLEISENENKKLGDDVVHLNDDLCKFKSENGRLKLDLDQTRTRLQVETMSNEKLKSILNETAKVIEEEIFTTKNKNNEISEKLSNAGLLQSLLEILVQRDFILVQTNNQIFIE